MRVHRREKQFRGNAVIGFTGPVECGTCDDRGCMNCLEDTLASDPPPKPTVTPHDVLCYELRSLRERTLSSARNVIRALTEFESRMVRDDADLLASIGQVPSCSTTALNDFTRDLALMKGYARALESSLPDVSLPPEKR